MTTWKVTTKVHEDLKVPAVVADRTVEEERRHRKLMVAAGYRILSRFGLDEGVAGHITARDPEFSDRFWTAPFGRWFGRMHPRALLQVDHRGKVIQGDGPLNTAAFAIHSAVHRHRPDVVGAAHAHGLHGKTFSALGRELSPLTQDATAFYGSHGLVRDYGGLVFDEAEGNRLADTLGEGKGLILANHGHLTVGTTVESAIWWFVTMERSFQSELLALSAGTPVPMAEEVAQRTAAINGSEQVGLFAFQPLFERICAETPDLLEDD